MHAARLASEAGTCSINLAQLASCKSRPVQRPVAPRGLAKRVSALKDRVSAIDYARLREEREHLEDLSLDDLDQDDDATTSLGLHHQDAAQAPTTPESTQPIPEFSGSLKGMLLLNLGAFLFGCNQVAIKTTEEIVDPLALDALRFGIAAVCFAPWLWGALKNTKVVKPAMELGLLLTAGYTAQAYGLEQTSAAHGSFTGTFTVLTVPVLVGLSGRRVAGRTWASAAVGLLGVALLTTSGGAPNWGDFWCIISAIIFGVHTWRSETITTRLSSSTTHLVSAQLFVLALATLLMALPEFCETYAATGPREMIDMAAALPWPAIFFMGAGTTAVTLWTEMTALKEVSAPLAALIYTSEPLWGAAFAWVLLNERWGTQGWIGAAIILSASLFTQLAGDPAERVHAEVEAGSDGKKSQ